MIKFFDWAKKRSVSFEQMLEFCRNAAGINFLQKQYNAID
ncbi:MAG: hypothetical protein K0Q48_2226 [Bacillota bacterium]|jgi:hypothetical protein|nr:hypothetical protein [Bacillota bacterium]